MYRLFIFDVDGNKCSFFHSESLEEVKKVAQFFSRYFDKIFMEEE